MTSRPFARPFLKWAGGKTQLLGPIAARLPDRIDRTYYEPFLGSGAVFFHLWSTGRLRGRVVLGDRNPALVETFEAVRDDVEALIVRLGRHRTAHTRDPKGHYYAVRAREPGDPVARAARVIYLNKTCYNGLWRVNRDGRFNVPLGRYRNPPILDADNLRAANRALRGVRIVHGHWRATVARARAGAVVYFDPPYAPVSDTARFTSYTAGGFDDDAQVALADGCARLAAKGVRFLLSNSDTERLARLYRARGFRVEREDARRAINSNAASRGVVRELLVSPGDAPAP